ncbi:MAG: DegT/DnrJ/EryC1/StrS family aminotransferase [Saprospiraceae bacterium]|nr:DegT/DnrJ/EryC1/StrS family aminotransferase [Saprospiraceae bacterium]
MIPVTKPFLPPFEEYNELLKGIWQRNWLTNNGPLVNQLESLLAEYLQVKHLLFLGNGTIALQIAIKALDLKGEIITTPFSYVATTSSIVWEGCNPIFADIHEGTLNIDPQQIESKITNKTTAILATHCFGNPCDINAIQKIADKHGIKVIYDGAHCFGTKYQERSVFNYGDITTASFHATKVFHSTEGGAVFTSDPSLLKRMSYMRNFGHDGPDRFNGVGINGKNSEFHAAMGLCNLKYINDILKRRKEQCDHYDRLLSSQHTIRKQQLTPDIEYNYSYYPVIFESEEMMYGVKRNLENSGIFPRRYFYPSLSQLDYIDLGRNDVSETISARILCLPLYDELTSDKQELIADILMRALR